MVGNFHGYKSSRNRPKFQFQNFFFAVLIFAISESGTHSDCFHSRPCAAVWIVHLCLRSILDYFSDSRHMDIRRSTQTHADEHRKMQTNVEKHRQTQTNADERKANCVWCVGRRNLKTRPDVRRLFKDFQDVLYMPLNSMIR